MSSLFLLNTSLLWPVNEIDYKLIVAVRAKTLLSQLYKSYLAALAKDEKIAILLETSNSYRSAAALLVCVMVTGGYVAAAPYVPTIAPYANYIFLACLFVLFLFAYRKQTQYIVARTKLDKEKSEEHP